jgi:hypothetical protein
VGWVDDLNGDLGSNALNLELRVTDNQVYTFEPDALTQISNFPILALTTSDATPASKTYVLKLDNAFLAANGVDTGVGAADVFLIDARGLPNGSVVQIDTTEIGGPGGYAGRIGVIASVGTNAQTHTGAPLGTANGVTVINGVTYGVDLTSPQTATTSTVASPAILTNAIGQVVLPEVVALDPAVPTYALTAAPAQVNETTNTAVAVTLATTNVVDGTVLPYTIAGTGITVGDFVGQAALTGNLTVTNNAATLNLTIAADALTEGTETFTVALGGGLATSNAVTITDTSLTPALTVRPLAGETAVTANPGAEAFVLNFDSSTGASLSSEAVVTITGFNAAEGDILRFNDANNPPISAANFLNVATGGALVVANGFANTTVISFQDDNPNDANPAAQVTLAGIQDATLGGAAPFYEVI